MKKRKTIILGSVIASIVIIALTYGLTYAYLIDRDDKDNIITVGNVNLGIVETGYEDSQPVVAHQIISKAPKVKNTGNTNEYVFLTVRVPKRNVTLLDTDGKKKYTDNNGKKIVEIFNIQTTAEGVAITGDTDVDFHYNGGKDADANANPAVEYAEGWILLSSKTTETGYDEYTFGYNKLLAPNASTHALFDKVQLKSFIDQEVTGENTTTKIDIQAYGIQTRNLGITDNWTNNKEQLTTDNLNAIFTIIKNKKNIT